MHEMTSSCASARPTAFPEINSVLDSSISSVTPGLLPRSDGTMPPYLGGAHDFEQHAHALTAALYALNTGVTVVPDCTSCPVLRLMPSSSRVPDRN
jgi:hypothetical protein